MIEFTGHLETDLPPDEVFELLADMAELDRWNPNVQRSRRTGGDRLQTGSTYLSTIVRGPIRMTARSELVAVEQSRMVRYEGSISGFWSIDWLTFDPTDGGTHITFRNQSRAPRWLRPLSPLLNQLFQRQANKAVEGAKRYLDGPAS